MAQPITYHTMIEAKRSAVSRVEVELFTAQLPEDRGLAPTEFATTPDLERTILDFGKFRGTKRLPVIKDILDRLFEATDADYLIYTNADIGLQPYFYSAVAELIGQGYDAFTINRRIVSDRYKSPEQILEIWSDVGKPHRGHDCFVFDRTLYPKFRLGRVCVGTGWFGRTLVNNFLCHARNPTLFADKHLTFHIGDVHQWRSVENREMFEFNRRESELVRQQLEAEFGPFDCTHIGHFKLKTPPGKSWAKRLASTFRKKP